MKGREVQQKYNKEKEREIELINLDKINKVIDEDKLTSSHKK